VTQNWQKSQKQISKNLCFLAYFLVKEDEVDEVDEG